MNTDHLILTAETRTFIAARIEELLTTKERNKTWLSKQSGIPLTTLERKLSGDADFTLPELARVARALDSEPHALIPPLFFPAAEPVAA